MPAGQEQAQRSADLDQNGNQNREGKAHGLTLGTEDAAQERDLRIAILTGTRRTQRLDLRLQARNICREALCLLGVSNPAALS